MKVVLVNPPMLRAEVTRVLGVKTPPMGLAYLAAVLEAEGYQPKIIDANALGLNYLALKKELEKENPDIVGVTAITPMIYEAMATIKVTKESSPNAVTIIGGPHATFCPSEILEDCPEVDVICLGEGEETLIDLVRTVEKRSDLRDVRGIVYRNNGHFFKTEPRLLIKDLDRLPFPARHLLPMNRYTVFARSYPMINIVSSRGCPFNCAFCSSSRIVGRYFRARTPQNVVDEIEQVTQRYKVNSFEFCDDTFTLDRGRVVKICEEIIRRGLDISWACSSRADLVTKDLLFRMKKAGCHLIFYGIESGSERILKLMKKGETHAEMIKAVKITKEVGIETLGSFILGYPDETKSELLQTIAFAKKIGVDFAEFSIATPYPGTELYEIALNRNLLLTKDWSEYTAAKPVIKPLHFSVQELSQFFAKAYRGFYSSPRVLIHHIQKRRIGIFSKVIKSLLSDIFLNILRSNVHSGSFSKREEK